MGEKTHIDIEQLLRRDKASWDAFVERFSSIIYSAVRRVFLNHTGKADAWDNKEAVQEVFLRLLKDQCRLLKSYDPLKASLATWITIVARSTTIDFLRRRRIETVPLSDSGREVGAAHLEDSSVLAVKIPPDLLSPRQRLILHLLFDREMKTSEVADILGIAAQTVRSSKQKALGKLRKCLEAQDSDRG